MLVSRSGSGSTGFMGRHRQGWNGAGGKHTCNIAEAETEGPGPSLNGVSGPVARVCCEGPSSGWSGSLKPINALGGLTACPGEPCN